MYWEQKTPHPSTFFCPCYGEAVGAFLTAGLCPTEYVLMRSFPSCHSPKILSSCYSNPTRTYHFLRYIILTPIDVNRSLPSFNMVQCRGARPHPFPSRQATPCTPATRRGRIGDCGGLVGPSDTPVVSAACRRTICMGCAVHTRNVLFPAAHNLLNHRYMPLCMKCQRHEANRHPDGINTCVCEENFSLVAGHLWKCHLCHRAAVDDAQRRQNRTNDWFLQIGKDRYGRFVYHPRRFVNRAKFPCAGCGSLIPWRWNTARDPLNGRDTVSLCTTCNGLKIIATIAPNWGSSRLAPGSAIRHSERNMVRNLRLPPLDFRAIGQPFTLPL